MAPETITQIIGIVGFLLGICAYLSRDDIHLKALIAVASFAMSLHLGLLGAFVGMGAAAFSGLRSFLSIFQSAKPLAPLFFIAYGPLAYFCYQDWIDILPLCAGLIGTYAMFYLDNLSMRYWLFVGTAFWFAHNLLQGSIGGSMLEGFYLAANVLTILRIRKNEPRDEVI